MLEPALMYGRFVRPLARRSVRRATRQATHARKAGDWRAVALHYSNALRADPKLAIVWTKLAHAQRRQGDLSGAEASYRRALAIDGKLVWAHLQLGHVLKTQGRFSEAVQSYLDALRLSPPGSLAERALIAVGYDDGAVTAARQGGPLPYPPLPALVAEADRARSARDWPAAEQRYREVLRAQPRFAELWVQLGHAQKEQGDLAAAEASYRRSLMIDDRSADTHLQLGHALKLQGRVSDAAASYFSALRLDSGHSSAMGELIALGYDGAAMAEASRPGFAPAAPPAISFAEADRARSARDWKRAAQHYQDVLRGQPRSAAIWVQLGHAQKEQGDVSAAEASYRQSLAIDDQLADTHLQLGHALKLQGRVSAAAESYLQAVRLDPLGIGGLRARRELIAFGYRNGAVSAAVQGGALAWPPAGQSPEHLGSRPILSMIGRNLTTVEPSGRGRRVLLREPIELPPGGIAVFVDVQRVDPQGTAAVEVAVLTADGPIPVHSTRQRHGPHIYSFECRSDAGTMAELVLTADLPPDCLIRRIEVGALDEARSWPLPGRGPSMVDLPPDEIRNFIIGSTGVCNASCIHCPTNKLRPSARWASEMPMKLFDSLVDQILDNRIFVTGHISLGLFGDGLLDRNVVERAKRLRAAFPHAPLHVNTNGAAYNSVRHAPLRSFVDVMAIHIETLDEEKYRRLMEPLQLDHVLPKIYQIIDDMPALATIASPVHRDNVDELPRIKEHFSGRGVRNMIFTPISNRCSRDETFQELALGPVSGTCPEEIMLDLIVDWDGMVLACCNDFLRQEPIGNLTQSSLSEILNGTPRRRFFDMLRTGAWEEMETCRTCKFG